MRAISSRAGRRSHAVQWFPAARSSRGGRLWSFAFLFGHSENLFPGPCVLRVLLRPPHHPAAVRNVLYKTARHLRSRSFCFPLFTDNPSLQVYPSVRHVVKTITFLHSSARLVLCAFVLRTTSPAWCSTFIPISSQPTSARALSLHDTPVQLSHPR